MPFLAACLAAASSANAGPTAQYWHELGRPTGPDGKTVSGSHVATGPKGALAIATGWSFREWQGRGWGAEEDATEAAGAGVRKAQSYIAASSDLAIGPGGTIYFAWEWFQVRKPDAPSFFVARRQGGRWRLVGGGPVPVGPMVGKMAGRNDLSLAVLPDGSPVLAYFVGRDGTHLKRWDGKSWAPMGDSAPAGAAGPFGSVLPLLRIAPDGGPVVFSRGGLKKWNGKAWAGLDGTGPGTPLPGGDERIYLADLAFDNKGNPYVVYAAGDDANRSVRLRHWTGAEWEELDGSASGKGIGEEVDARGGIRVCADRAGMPIVAWVSEPRKLPGVKFVYVKRWDGEKWRELGRGSASGGGISGPDRGHEFVLSLAIDSSGRPMVAWSGSRFCLRVCALAPGRKR